MMDEFDFINNIKKTHALDLIGDDCAVLPKDAETDLLVTADMLVEEIDFRLDWTTPRLLGHKALAVSLSDIAAMGGAPGWSLLSIGVPEYLWNSKFLDEFYEGWHELARLFEVRLAGGDVSRTHSKLVIDSVVGGTVPKGKAVLRSGALPGDAIYVSGPLGGAAAGLKLLQNGERYLPIRTNPRSGVLLKQLRPLPRLGLGIQLRESNLATSMIDLSDGLSSDLNHLCNASGVGARIDSSLLPIDDRVVELCGRRALDPLQLALHGGEDFELLFAVRPEDAARLPRRVDGVSIKRIGEITDSSEGVKISEGPRIWDLKPGGWKHF